MLKYDIITNFDEIFKAEGIWTEYLYDIHTQIWEKGDNRYMVPFSKDCVINVNTGEKLSDSLIEDLKNVNKDSIKYRWMLALKFNPYIL